MATGQALQLAAERQAQFVIAQRDRFARAAGDALRSAIREFARTLRFDLDLDQQGRIERTTRNLGLIVTAAAVLQTAYHAHGFESTVAAERDTHLELADFVRDLLTELGLDVVENDDLDQAIALVGDLDRADLLDTANSSRQQIMRLLAAAVLGTLLLADVLDRMVDMTEKTIERIVNAYDQSLTTLGRLITQTSTPSTFFLYAGPIDDRNRDFCLNHVGRLFTRAQIDGMVNDQPAEVSDVWTHCGGYNCRHIWQPLGRLTDDLQRIAESGEPLPGLAPFIESVERGTERRSMRVSRERLSRS